MSNVGDYQSMVQLVVGANLAFFTFPELRQPSLPRLEVELKRWISLLETVPASELMYDAILARALGVRDIRRAIERRLGSVRVLCLGLASVYSLLLLWMCHYASQPTSGAILEVASLCGAVPAAAVAYLNVSTSQRLATASIMRRRFEREFMQGTLE